MTMSRSVLKMTQTAVVEKIKTFNNYFRKSCRLWDNVE